MGNSYSSDVTRLLGEDGLKGASLTKLDGDMVNFLVPLTKQSNYLKYCSKIEPCLDPTSAIRQYTDHVTEHYARINISLAADSDGLQKYSDYIPQLRSAIMNKPLLDDGLVYRGVNLTDSEIEHMERNKRFFIPSFTSTSIESSKAYAKSALMVIKLPYGCRYACSITNNLSKHYYEEREVLLSCYSAFHLERVEYVNNTKILSLYLDEHLSALNSLK